MKIFIINLKSKSDLRLKMMAQINALNLNAEFIDAIVGNELSDKEISDKVHNYPDCQLTKGEIGCALSHLTIYEKMVRDNINMALILEDDAILNPDVSAVLSNLENIDNNDKPNIYLLSKPEKYIKNKKIEMANHSLYSVYDASGAHGYVINNLAARKMMTRMKPLKWECDMWGEFRLQGLINLYCILPTVIVDGDSNKATSSLEKERINTIKKREQYRNLIKKAEPHYQFRRIKNNFLKKFVYKIATLP